MSRFMHRRQVITGFALTVSAVSFGLEGRAAAAVVGPLGWAPVALTLTQARTVDAVAEAIVPATDTPGARAAGVPQWFDRTLRDWCSRVQGKILRTGLDQLDADARSAHGASFADLTQPDQTLLLARYDATGSSQRPFFGLLKELITVGYFTSKPGSTMALRYDPIPGAYHGCVPLKQIGRSWATS